MNEQISKIQPNKGNQAVKSDIVENSKGSFSLPKLSSQENSTKKKTNKKLRIKMPNRKVVIAVSIVILLLGLLVLMPFLNLYKKGRAFNESAQRLMASTQSQDLNAIRSELENTQSSLGELDGAYKYVSWTKFVPFLGNYSKDAKHAITAGEHGIEAAFILLDTIEPYADLIGFSGGNGDINLSGEQTAKDRIDFIAKSLPEIAPRVDELSEKMEMVNIELEQIDPSRYPETFAGRKIRSNLEMGLDLVNEATKFVTDGKPLLKVAPALLGLDEERSYLILFQNDKELRPTGGFMTAYSIMKVDEARFEPTLSNDIYDLDVRYKPRVDAPQPVVDYLKGPYILSQKLRLRDMNWSPDFAESMDLFTKESESIGLEDYDGIIAVDTQLLVNILEVLGPIGVTGFGNFSTEIIDECNCPQVIYELESFADVEGPIIWDPVTGEIILRPPNSDNRKKIIGPLMNSIMANTLGQPKEKFPDLAEAVFKSLSEKHLLFYFFDETEQEAVEKFGIAGKIEDYEGDYLHINDANLGGRKSNMYVTQEVHQDISVGKDGTVTKTVEITYKNPEKHDGWLNSVLPNWVRIYVPKGSELVDFSGVEDEAKPYEEFGKTVYAGYFELRPQGVSKVSLTYKLPFKVDKSYKLLIQKQPGPDSPLYSVSLGKNQEEFFLKEDEEIKFKI